MATVRRVGIKGPLMAAAVVCILAPFVSVATLLLGKLIGFQVLVNWGYMLLLGEVFTAPYLCITCLFVLLLSLRCKEPVPASYAVFGLLLNLFGLWAFIGPTVAT